MAPTHEQADEATVPVPAVGDLVRDGTTGRVGEIVDHRRSRCRLRPLGGGIEWDAAAGDIRPATRAEVLSARVAAANAGSRQGRVGW
ncbi:hypothetical protein ACFP1Z_07485 [Streptomyces gamaensis]|uniref:DUF2171 domain-containing protein n=1 Tax=Streptomyces gamaensis TaxID=1763542 RepID=A0ABW0YUY4_9ACTN